MRNYQPFTLVNADYKLVSGCVAARLDTGINGASKMASDLRAPWRDGVRIKSAREARSMSAYEAAVL